MCVNAHIGAIPRSSWIAEGLAGGREISLSSRDFPSTTLDEWFILSETERERRKRKRQRGQELSALERRVTLSEKQRGNCVFLDDDRNRTLKQSYGND